MAGTETIGGSNAVFDISETTTYEAGCIEANEAYRSVLICDSITHNESTTEFGPPCLAQKDEDVLRYIYLY